MLSSTLEPVNNSIASRRVESTTTGLPIELYPAGGTVCGTPCCPFAANLELPQIDRLPGRHAHLRFWFYVPSLGLRATTRSLARSFHEAGVNTA
jgi:hypothetical protein